MARPGGFEAVELEMLAERAAAIGRLGRRVEETLAAVAAHRGEAREREELLAIAGEALWFYVVQREVLGWYDHEVAFAAYRVPGEVLRRMGPRLAPRG